MSEALELPAAGPVTRTVLRSMLLTLPMTLWALLMFSGAFGGAELAPKLGALVALLFMVGLFFAMVKTGRTFRWRRIFFVALGFLFPIGFIWDLIELRHSMSIPIDRMLTGDTPFCFLAIPMMIVPAALYRTVIFPGSILPSASNPHAMASMVGIWLAATLVLGKGWCAWGCFFGGIEEGMAALPRKARIRKIDRRFRLVPWAVLAAVVLLSAATFEPIYCAWLCPFKTVTEFPEVRSIQTGIQFGVFLLLFLGLVVTAPLLTKRRTQCAFFCPMGAFQSAFNFSSIFDLRVDRSRCTDCLACERVCPTLAIDATSIRKGKTRPSCMRCGACADQCPKGAVLWHVKGTPLSVRPETARLLYLYTAWTFATMFGGSILAGSLTRLFGILV
jgi:ferredoxin-type protein NapH